MSSLKFSIGLMPSALALFCCSPESSPCRSSLMFAGKLGGVLFDLGCLFLLLRLDRASISPIASFVRARLDEGVGAKVARRRFLRLIWVPSSPDKSVCSPKRITWVNTQKNKLKVKAFSLAYDFLKWLVLPGSGALSG